MMFILEVSASETSAARSRSDIGKEICGVLALSRERTGTLVHCFADQKGLPEPTMGHHRLEMISTCEA